MVGARTLPTSATRLQRALVAVGFLLAFLLVVAVVASLLTPVLLIAASVAVVLWLLTRL